MFWRWAIPDWLDALFWPTAFLMLKHLHLRCSSEFPLFIRLVSSRADLWFYR